MWEGVGDRTELQHIDHNHLSFLFSWASQPGAWGPNLSGCWFSLPHLISNSSDLQTDWISCTLSYMIVQRSPSSCGRHNFALIQPVHCQGYNILIFLDRMYLLLTQVHFLFWQPGRVGGQYTTHVVPPSLTRLNHPSLPVGLQGCIGTLLLYISWSFWLF